MSRRRLMMAQRSGEVPSEYSDIYYIQNSSGTGYIDTGFMPNQSTNVNFTIVPFNDKYIFGARNSAVEKNFGFYAYAPYDTARRPRFEYNDASYFLKSTQKLCNVWECHNEGNVMYFDVEGTTYSITADAATFQCEHNMYLFGTNNNGTPSVSNGQKLIAFKIYDNGTLIRDYQPKVRLSDGKYGLWDNVNNTFNLSADGTAFTGGIIEDMVLNYQAITDKVSDKVRIPSSNAYTTKRATLLQLRTENNAIDWYSTTPSSISSRYTLMHKGGDNLTITLNNSSYYCAITVYVRNGTTYTSPYSIGWTATQLTSDLSSINGDEVWVSVNFKFNNAGSAEAVLSDDDYTLTWS